MSPHIFMYSCLFAFPSCSFLFVEGCPFRAPRRVFIIVFCCIESVTDVVCGATYKRRRWKELICYDVCDVLLLNTFFHSFFFTFFFFLPENAFLFACIAVGFWNWIGWSVCIVKTVKRRVLLSVFISADGYHHQLGASLQTHMEAGIAFYFCLISFIFAAALTIELMMKMDNFSQILLIKL